ncbi:efflux RND transporter permease subunit [Aliiglaciecola sp. CAU 1673]|uniref:efflux RND transporter permease subunit n=1 Tax=Aliiglaciecola sp. CAU 1673 TaxID=3032595 RepID=UPI0023DCB8D9|nr:efflux RND transporter permease subunit [Aliiglaciecola sp. CAU 1673]MDF2176662.1 efflux RND transporter permease subunit [Aliiglaciecola sp. CAU 1673]
MAMSESSPWYTAFYRRGHLLALSIVILLVAGLSALTHLPRLEDPRIDTRNVLILTPYPGASAERVETLVTDVLEDELRQLHEIKEIKSTSRSGISTLSVELQAWVNNHTNEAIFSKIRDRLNDASARLPQGAGVPELDDKRAATAFTLVLGLLPKDPQHPSLPLLSRLADELADRMRNVPGTELVRIYGELDEEVLVSLDSAALGAAQLELQDISRLVAASDPKLPAGILRGAQQDSRLQVAQELDSLSRIRDLPLRASDKGGLLRLGDIAEVERAWRTPVNDLALINGERGVMVAVRMQPTVRVDNWVAAAKQELAAFNNQYGGSLRTDILFDQNEYTQARLSDLTQNLLLGCLVVMAVVLVFMGKRSALIVGLALPLSAGFTLFSLNFFDEQIHQMSIFGIIIAIGLLIDNAIVVTDEIRARLLEPQNSRLQALVGSLRHLFVPLLSSTLTTVLGFMPIFLLPGNIGDFVGPIAISVVMALLGSLAISLTIIAALAARYLPREEVKADSRWWRTGVQWPGLTDAFAKFLGTSLKNPLPSLSLVVGLSLAGFVLASQLGNVFFPSADRDQFQIYFWMPSGTAISHTTEQVQKADALIRADEDVKQVTWLVGGSSPSVYYNQIMNKDGSPHFANAVITATGVEQAAGLIARLQSQLDEALPEAKVVVRAFGQGPPISAPVGVEIYGQDLETLATLGEQVRLAMSETPGITQSIASISLGESELQLAVSREIGQFTQLPLTDIAMQLQSSLEGSLGGSVLEDTEEIPVRIRLNAEQRSDIGQLAGLPLLNSHLAIQQRWVPVSALGDLKLLPNIDGITRTNGSRVNRVEAFLTPSATAIDVNRALNQKLREEGFELPPGYRIKMAGDADEQQEAVGQLATYLPVLVVLMLTTLILTFHSVRNALVIAAVALLSTGYGLLSLWISGLPLGFNPLLGTAGLIGVAINGSIVVIAAINANPQARAGDRRAIVRETMGCSRHILSTTVTTVGGFVPLLLFSAGTFWPPLAVVLAGGVGFSVLLSLGFTPVVMAWIGARRARQEQIVPELGAFGS